MTEIVGPAWAYGCGECTFGLALDAPIPRSSMSFYEVRRMQAREEIIVFCECRAGQAYKAFTARQDAQIERPAIQPPRPTAPRANLHEMPPAVAEELLDIYA